MFIYHDRFPCLHLQDHKKPWPKETPARKTNKDGDDGTREPIQIQKVKAIEMRLKLNESVLRPPPN